MSHVAGSHSIPFLYKLKQLDLEGGCQGARAVTTRCWASKRKRSKVKGKVLSFAKIRRSAGLGADILPAGVWSLLHQVGYFIGG